MSRKKGKVIQKKEIKPDVKYNSVIITRFINKVLLHGKKRVAERIVYGALDELSKSVNKPAIEAFEDVLKNARPKMEVKPKRVGGSTYQVPMEVAPDRAMSLAMKWIVLHSRQRSGRSMQENLQTELIDIYNNTGTTIKKKQDVHKMAEANKAFAHFRH